MTGLRSLGLHMNLIKKIEGLHTLRQLEELDLSGNEISQLDKDCLAGLGRLKRLNLSSNVLRSVPPHILEPLHRLEWLSLGYNELTDISGLRSISASTPLSYVDLCGNAIQTVAQVEEALSVHRTHIRELRLESPPVATALRMAGGVVVAPSLRENPFCTAKMKPAAEVLSHAPRGSGVHSHYVERVLAYFPNLVTLNGVTYGVDPLHDGSLVPPLPQAPLSQASQLLRPADEKPGAAAQRPLLPGHHGVSSSSTAFIQPWYRTAMAAGTSHPALRRGKQWKTSHIPSDVPPRSRSVDSTVSSRTESTTNSSCTEPRRPRRRRHHRCSSSSQQCRCARSVTHRNVTESLNNSSPTEASHNKPEAPVVPVDCSTPRMTATEHQGAIRSKERLTPAALSDSASQGITPPGHHADTTESSPQSTTTPQQPSRQRKRVSRGVNTDLSIGASPTDATVSAAEPSTVVAADESLTQRLAADRALAELHLHRAQEQLQLRMATESDLRRNLELCRQRCLDVSERAEHQQRQLTAQVAALKDELLRRSQEACMIQRKNSDAQRGNEENRLQLITKLHEKDATLRRTEEALRHSQAAVAEVTRQQDADRASAANMKATWQRDYGLLRREYESLLKQFQQAEQQWQAVGRQHDRVTSLQFFVEAERAGRHQLEVTLLSSLLTAAQKGYQALVHVAVTEQEAVRRDWRDAQHNWEAYTRSAGEQFSAALLNAEHEVQRLEKQLSEACSTIAEQKQKLATAVQDGVKGSSTPLISCGTQVEEVGPHVLAIGVDSSDRISQNHSDSTPVEAYWHRAYERAQRDAQRWEAACTVAGNTHAAVAHENTRLLAALKESEDLAAKQGEDAAQEREGLLRTLHNLRDDLAKKDAAMDALEAEARVKIDEKRVRIAELEGLLEGVQGERDRATAASVAIREKLAQSEKQVTALQEERRAAQDHEARLRDACAAAESARADANEYNRFTRQYEEDKVRLTGALMLAREQLIRLHEAHGQIGRELQERTVALAQQTHQTESLQLQVKAIQEGARAKQLATMEALSRVMLADSV